MGPAVTHLLSFACVAPVNALSLVEQTRFYSLPILYFKTLSQHCSRAGIQSFTIQFINAAKITDSQQMKSMFCSHHVHSPFLNYLYISSTPTFVKLIQYSR